MKRKRMLILLAILLLVIPAIPASAAGLAYDNAQLNAVFNCIDGGQISTQSEGGKPKILIFFTTTCGNCRNTLIGISSSEWIKSGETDVCAIEISQKTLEEVRQYRDTNCPNSMIRFGTDESSNACNLAFEYFDIGWESGNAGTPFIALVDANNQLQYFRNGYTSSGEIENYLPDLRPETDPDDPQPPDDGSDSDDPQPPDDGSDSDDPQPPDDGSDSDDPQPPDDGSDPDDPQPPDDGSDPDDPQPPDDGSDPDNPQPPDNRPDKEEQEATPDEGKAACNHVGEMVTVSDATPVSDAVAAYQCIKCGTVYKYEAVANSAYAAFLKETEDIILNAQQGEAVINTRLWTSFHKSVFEAMKSRPDVTVTVNYFYEGNEYVLTIPAGTDVDLLMDENGFGGFRYMDKVLNKQ